MTAELTSLPEVASGLSREVARGVDSYMSLVLYKVPRRPFVEFGKGMLDSRTWNLFVFPTESDSVGKFRRKVRESDAELTPLSAG